MTDPKCWPAVSVVVPTRNRPELLPTTLAAIRGQDYPGSVDTLVVFDQSEPDRALEEQGERRGVRVLTNVRTPGLAGARNSGILAADAELVAFCDDDDVWHPGKLRAQVAALRAHAPEGVAPYLALARSTALRALGTGALDPQTAENLLDALADPLP